MITPEIRRELSHLFVALEYGEQLAHRCATQQANWVSSTKAHRFLTLQAKQEYSHARFFEMAANNLKVKHQYTPPCALKSFASRLEKTFNNNNLVESMVGSQIVLEGFGEQILMRLNKGLDDNDTGFKKIRHALLRQEQSHYAFGMHMLKTQLQNGEASIEHIVELTNEYMQFIHNILHEMKDVFYILNEDPQQYAIDLVNNLPQWLREKLD